MAVDRRRARHPCVFAPAADSLFQMKHSMGTRAARFDGTDDRRASRLFALTRHARASRAGENRVSQAHEEEEASPLARAHKNCSVTAILQGYRDVTMRVVCATRALGAQAGPKPERL